MKLSFYNIGCKVNFAETSQLREDFQSIGCEIVEFGAECDAVIINTCTVTKNADADCRKIIRRAHRLNPKAFIGVVGCYAQMNSEEISKIEGVDAIIGTKDKFNLREIVGNFKKNTQPLVMTGELKDAPFHSASSVDNESHTRIVLKIQDGCDYFCSYCIVPHARGHSRSMDFGELKAEIEKLEDSDLYEIILSGINLGEYRANGGERFIDALKFIESKKRRQRYRISSIEPNLLSSEIIELAAGANNLCPHFHIPLQSGSDEILKKMRRRYKSADFAKLISEIKLKIPHCAVGVDVITGFPGESEENFMETYKLLESLPVSYLHVFTYSEREAAQAINLEGKIPHQVKKKRTIDLRKLSDEKRNAFYQSNIGKIFTVIPEEYDEKLCRWKGWTENYIRTGFNAGKELKNKPVKVRLTAKERDIVLGELIS